MKKLLCLLLVVGMLMTGSAAWAVGDIPMSINHMTDVEVVSGKTDYNAGDNHKEFYQAVMDAMVASVGSEEEKEAHADDIALGAKYFNVKFSILNMFFNGRGHATLFSNGETLMRAWSDRDELVGWRILKGEGTFPVNQNSWGAYVITNDDGVEYELHGGAEIALSGQRIKFVPEGTTTVLSGDLPTILTTAKQMEGKRVPYVEYKLNGDKTEVTGFDLRFVDPANPSVPLKAGIPGAAGTIALASDSYTYRISSEDLDFYTSKKTVWNEGDDMKDSVDFADIPNMPASVKLTELDGIEVRFSVNPSDVMYEWFFNTKENEENEMKRPADIGAATLTPESAAAVAGELAVKPNKFVSFNDGEAVIETDSKIFAGYGDETDAINTHTVSAISVSQDVGEGNALIVGKPIFPLNPISIGDRAIEWADDIDTIDKLKTRFKALKYFQKGGSINLLDKFADLFELSEGALKFKADLVIIDGPVPDGDEDTERVFVGNTRYGVRASKSRTVLFVYDGVADGYASDPIAFMANAIIEQTKDPDPKKDPDPSNGSSGCNAGFGLFGLVTLSGVAFLRKKD